jgi:hypothetical protein
LSGLISAGKLTYRLFDEEHYLKWENLYRAVDAVNDRFGRDTIRLGSARADGPWRMKQARKSPHFTTRLRRHGPLF